MTVSDCEQSQEELECVSKANGTQGERTSIFSPSAFYTLDSDHILIYVTYEHNARHASASLHPCLRAAPLGPRAVALLL